MRRPSDQLVVDAAILVAFARGSRIAVLSTVAEARALTSTKRAFDEARKRVDLGMSRPDLLPFLDALMALIDVIEDDRIEHFMFSARLALKNAVPSGNGSTRDAHILALAWLIDADIWSPDRDFAGTGVASWSTPNLVRALQD